jgi:hypothetical protein
MLAFAPHMHATLLAGLLNFFKETELDTECNALILLHLQQCTLQGS